MKLLIDNPVSIVVSDDLNRSLIYLKWADVYTSPLNNHRPGEGLMARTFPNDPDVGAWSGVEWLPVDANLLETVMTKLSKGEALLVPSRKLSLRELSPREIQEVWSRRLRV